MYPSHAHADLQSVCNSNELKIFLKETAKTKIKLQLLKPTLMQNTEIDKKRNVYSKPCD